MVKQFIEYTNNELKNEIIHLREIVRLQTKYIKYADAEFIRFTNISILLIILYYIFVLILIINA
jgi:hypothetical protein